ASIVPTLSALTVTFPTGLRDVPTIEPVSISARIACARGAPPMVTKPLGSPILFDDIDAPTATPSPAPMPPLIAAAAAPAVAVIPELSFAQTVTSLPPVRTVLARIRGSLVLAIVLSAVEPAPATLTPAPPPALMPSAIPIATASMTELDVAVRLRTPFDVNVELSLAPGTG